MSDQIDETLQKGDEDRLNQLVDILFGTKSREIDAQIKMLETAVLDLKKQCHTLTQELQSKGEYIQSLESIVVRQKKVSETSNHHTEVAIQKLLELFNQESTRSDAMANALHGLQSTQDDYANQMLNQINITRKQTNKQYAMLEQYQRDSYEEYHTTSIDLQNILEMMKETFNEN